MKKPRLVILSATTESLRGRSRVRVNEAYTSALASAGLIPVVLPPVDAAIATAALDGIAGLVLTGGEDVGAEHFGQTPHPAMGTPHPGRDEYELALARAARERRIPTLAICRGAQVINVALGGTLIQDIPSLRPSAADHDQSNRRTERVHPIAIEGGTALASIVGDTSIAVNSSHHQAVDLVAPTLRVSATSPDGVIEALEPTDDWWMIAVQWHPEELTATPEPWDRRLFSAFAEAVRSGD
ncbi:MAG TPA: gamma-glutamyl-gamma-aminobutyrate hydrolase family protein [Gemmatimonadaceae bacterium]|jgi:putative glutamine amidotransferase